MVGGCYHKALEINFMQKISTCRDLSASECCDIFSDEWDYRLSREEDINWEGKSQGYLKDQGFGLVAEYMQTTAFSVQPVEVEKEYWRDIAGVPFVCRIDLRDGNKIVIDHKTSARAYTQDAIDRDHQATSAAFVLNSGIVYHNHVAVKTRVPKIQIMKTYRTTDDIDWWIRMTELDIAQMKTGVCPPRTESWLCSKLYCGFWDMCKSELSKKTF